MKTQFLVLALILSLTLSAKEPDQRNLDAESKLIADRKWFGGAADCDLKGMKEPLFEVLTVNPDYHILRQNKCITFEAPFLYLFIGEHTAFLFDTGAEGEFPLRKWVDKILKDKREGYKLVVAHSHSHGDHVTHDDQFRGRPHTTIIGLSPSEVAAGFGIKKWPLENAELDLGKRKLTIIPIPGHEASSIAVYDHETQDLLTGDSLYPGNIFLSASTWKEYKTSIDRLHAFSQNHRIRNILGAHVEMSRTPKKEFAYGSTFHPNEHKLPLYQGHLDELKKFLETHGEAVTHSFNDFMLTP